MRTFKVLFWICLFGSFPAAILAGLGNFGGNYPNPPTTWYGTVGGVTLIWMFVCGVLSGCVILIKHERMD